MTSPNVLSSMTTEQLVSIVGVDVVSNTATGQTRQRTQVSIDTRYLVGAMHVTPAVGEQWYIKRVGRTWALDRKLPFNTDTLANIADNPVEGQVQIGSSGVGSGPLQLLGSQINVNAPLKLQAAATTELPDASSVSPGCALWDSAVMKVVISDGQDWRDTLGNVVLGGRGGPLVGNGTLTAGLVPNLTAFPSPVGHGVLSAGALGGPGRLASHYGSGAITVTTTTRYVHPAVHHGHGAITVTTKPKIPAHPNLAGHGALSIIRNLSPRFNSTAGTHGWAWSVNYSHTIEASTTLLLVVLTNGSDDLNYYTRTVKVGSTRMTSIKEAVNASYGIGGSQELYAMLNPPTGAQTISATLSGGSGQPTMSLQSFAYANVGSIGTPISQWGFSPVVWTASTPAVASQSNDLVFGSLCVYPGQHFSNPNGTQRWYWPEETVSGYAYAVTLVEDTPGAASVVLTADMDHGAGATANGWSAIGLNLHAVQG